MSWDSSKSKGRMTTNQGSRDFVIAPNIEQPGDLASFLPFLNLYRDRGFYFFERLSFKSRHLSSILDFFKGLNAKVTQLKKENCYDVDLLYRGSEFVIFVRDISHEASIMHLSVMTNSSQDLLNEFVYKIPTTDVGNNSSFDLRYYYLSKQHGVSSKELYVDISSFTDIYPALYPDIDIARLTQQYQNASEPILILYGDPGVGKTTFIKYIIAHGSFKDAAYIKDPLVMEDGGLWSTLTSEDYDLIIFDDLDVNLLPRRKNSESTFMTQLLSYSDGLFTQGKVKIVITTNQTVKEIDSALVRPGRCFDFLRLNNLSREDARSFWSNTLFLSVVDFDARFTGDYVTQAALMSEAMRMKGSMGERSYIKRGNNKYTLDDKLSELGIQASDGESSKAGF